ncbi:MAG: translation initiation factor IF-2 [Bacteroidales bacterium]
MYEKDRKTKEKADSVPTLTRKSPGAEKKTLVEPEPEPESEKGEVVPTSEILIVDITLKPTETKQEEPIRESRTRLEGPKILGKIDIKDEKIPSSKPNVKVSTPEPKTEQVTPTIVKAETIQNETQIVSEDKAVKQPDIVEVVQAEETSPAEVVVEPAIQVTVEEPVLEKAVEEEKTESIEAIQPEAELKENLPVEAQAPEASIKEETIKEETKTEEDNFIPVNVQKIEGPKVVGKVDLDAIHRPTQPKPDKKKPVASSQGPAPASDKKRKRKRISEEKIETGKTDEAKTDKTSKFKIVTRSEKKKKAQERHGFREEVKPEIDQEEIQKQVKETLAKLTQQTPSKASKARKIKKELIKERQARQQQEMEESAHTLKVTEFLTANELASLMNVPVTDVIKLCMDLGRVVSINQRLDAETIQVIASEFGYEVDFSDEEIEEEVEFEDNPEDLVPRAPIVTVMGHVDHGKTKLLDYIRNTNVVAGEAGGITQHIGAYEVTLPNGKKITFLDTPGHEAFTAMRARGAKVTDIAIIIIAADDGVMPTTREAINHAIAADVPMVFAINKVDKPTANPTKVREDLAHMNLLVEDWGGKYQVQEISAKTGQGVDLLLEKVLLEAELMELKANPKRPAVGTVIESSLDKGRGYVAKLLVQNGTLRQGDVLVAGSVFGKVKAMYNERNQLVKEVGPSSPILVLGLTGAPQAGDKFQVYADEKEARNIANKRQQLQREIGLRTQKHITLEEIGRRIAIGDFKELNIIVKGDVDGSVEALTDSLLKLSTEEVQVNIIHKSVGQITETDVMLASASNAIIVGFNVRPSEKAKELARQEQIDIRIYSIIYQAIEEIQSAIEGMMTPKTEEKIVCNVEVREVFHISKVGTVAGCMVLDGTLTRHTKIRVIRDGIVIHTGSLGSLKRFKDDVKEVKAGQDCGLTVNGFNDIVVGDIIEGYEIVEVKK